MAHHNFAKIKKAVIKIWPQLERPFYMKHFFSNRIIIAILFFVIGGVTDLAFNSYLNNKKKVENIQTQEKCNQIK